MEQYQKSRQVFVQAIADHANRSQSVEILFEAGVISQLKPLLMDHVPNIQQTAALALGRISAHSERFAESIIDSGVLPHLVFSLTEQNVSRTNYSLKMNSKISSIFRLKTS